MRYLASELGERNIRVNAISAGPVKTASARAIKGFSGILEAAERNPLRRNTDPAEATEADLAQEFTDAFEARDLPEKFFYWFPRSAADWTALAADPELYGGLSATWKELGSSAIELGSHFHGRVPVISFGAGDGARD